MGARGAGARIELVVFQPWGWGDRSGVVIGGSGSAVGMSPPAGYTVGEAVLVGQGDEAVPPARRGDDVALAVRQTINVVLATGSPKSLWPLWAFPPITSRVRCPPTEIAVAACIPTAPIVPAGAGHKVASPTAPWVFAHR